MCYIVLLICFGLLFLVAELLLLSLAVVIFSLRAKTWQRFSLRQEIRSSSMPEPEKFVRHRTGSYFFSGLAIVSRIAVSAMMFFIL